MSRKPRLEFPGAIHHINHRGNHQEYIYRDAFKLYAYTQSDIAVFLDLSRSAISKVICKTK